MNDSLILAIGVGAGIAMLLGVALLSLAGITKAKNRRPDPVQSEMVVLFKSGLVIDSTPDAPEILDRPYLQGLAWEDLRTELLRRFPDLPHDLPRDDMQLIANDDPDTILSTTTDARVTRLTIRSKPINPGQLHRLVRERGMFERLSAVMDLDPNPAWLCSENDVMLWHNVAYANICDDLNQTIADTCPFKLMPRQGRAKQVDRVSVSVANEADRWYEVQSLPVPEGWLHFATSIDSLVEAEMAQRNFVQTLTKTFAHLPIGLAVFDRERRLVLFNPALVDLTNLPVDFLSSRPNLFSFFDHMRDNRMMPEPKNYVSWREKLHDVVSAAREDRYNETWNLPSGLTYRITGRPHPDGAVAFLIEDISAEISLTRRFRSELELTQSVLDSLDNAVAVFSRTGTLGFTNRAYRHMWDCDPDGAFAEITIADATRDWKKVFVPTNVWAQMDEYVTKLQDRDAVDVELTRVDGGRLHLRYEPVAAGATLIRFGSAPISPLQGADAPDLVNVNAAPSKENAPGT